MSVAGSSGAPGLRAMARCRRATICGSVGSSSSATSLARSAAQHARAREHPLALRDVDRAVQVEVRPSLTARHRKPESTASRMPAPIPRRVAAGSGGVGRPRRPARDRRRGARARGALAAAEHGRGLGSAQAAARAARSVAQRCGASAGRDPPIAPPAACAGSRRARSARARAAHRPGAAACAMLTPTRAPAARSRRRSTAPSRVLHLDADHVAELHERRVFGSPCSMVSMRASRRCSCSPRPVLVATRCRCRRCVPARTLRVFARCAMSWPKWNVISGPASQLADLAPFQLHCSGRCTRPPCQASPSSSGVTATGLNARRRLALEEAEALGELGRDQVAQADSRWRASRAGRLRAPASASAPIGDVAGDDGDLGLEVDAPVARRTARCRRTGRGSRRCRPGTSADRQKLSGISAPRALRTSSTWLR